MATAGGTGSTESSPCFFVEVDMALKDQTTEELIARRLRSINSVKRLKDRLAREQEVVDWLVLEIDAELDSRVKG